MGVYVIFCDQLCRTKIGRSDWVDKRFAGLRTASPADLELIGYWEMHGSTSEDAALEALLHATFDRERTHGEWFAVMPYDVKTVVDGWLEADHLDLASRVRRFVCFVDDIP